MKNILPKEKYNYRIIVQEKFIVGYTLEYNGETIYERWYGYGNVGIVDLDEL